MRSPKNPSVPPPTSSPHPPASAPPSKATASPHPPAYSPPSPSPHGTLPTIVPCCPDVTTFEGSTGARSTYFGFDDKTNLVANVGVDEYWIPPAAAKALPSNKEDRDGARWVSVGVGKETQVEINFGGTYTNGCLLNCSYEVDPPSIADVTSAKPTATGVDFKIKGKTVGEASLKVVCNGDLKGYFHIWCATTANLTVDLGTIVSTRTSPANYTTTDVQAALNEIYRQALLNITINDIGLIDLSGDKNFALIESIAYSSTGFSTSPTFLTTLNVITQAKLLSDAAAQSKTYVPAAYQMFYYIPSSVSPNAGGSVINIGSSPGFCFFDHNLPASYNSVAHELGHSLGLRHPDDLPDVTGQIAAHLIASRGKAVSNIPATNTEPAVSAAPAHGTVMAEDPLNLMGYWSQKPVRKPIRYGQWKTCKRS